MRILGIVIGIVVSVAVFAVGTFYFVNQKRNNSKPTAMIVTVKPGDTLWEIAKGVTGDSRKWRKIAEKNFFLKERFFVINGEKTGVLIYPGEKLVISSP